MAVETSEVDAMTFPVRITDAPLWKTPPAPVVKAVKAKDEEKERKRIKKLVFARDKSKCRVCGVSGTAMTT